MPWVFTTMSKSQNEGGGDMKRENKLRSVFLAILVFVLVGMPLAGKSMAAQLELDDQTGQLGDRVTFTLSVNNAPNEVSSLGVDIGFNQSVLEFQSADFSGTLLEGWSFKQVSNPLPGVLRLGGFTVVDAIEAGESGDLVKLEFEVIGTEDCPLPLSALRDGIAGWTTKDGTFTYLLPTVTGISPDSGPTSGGQSVTITGTNFFGLVDPPAVFLGGEEATDVVLVSPAEITCTTPAHPEGLVDVVVTNPDGKSATLAQGYEYVAFGIDPSSVTLCEGGSVDFEVVPEEVGVPPFTWSVDGVEMQTGDSREFEHLFKVAGSYTVAVEDSSVPPLTAQATATVLAEDDSGALDIEAGSGSSGDEVTVAVRILGAPNQVASLGFDVIYDPNVLTYVESARGELVQDFDFYDTNPIEPGRVRSGGFEAGEDKIPAGASGSVVELTFQVNPDLDPDECISSFLELVELKDDIGGWPVSGACFLVNCACTGDVNGDGEITPMDALCAFEAYLLICPTSCGIPCEDVCGDVTRDGEITPADALCIFQEYLQLPSCLD